MILVLLVPVGIPLQSAVQGTGQQQMLGIIDEKLQFVPQR